MSDYQIYVFLLCFVVFILLASLSVFCTFTITRLTIKLINSGVEDEKILKEYNKQKNKEKKKYRIFIKIFDYAFVGIVSLVLLFTLISALSVRSSDNSIVGDSPVYRVVNTGSMAEKNAENEYLTENALNDQIQTFDLIKTEKLPDEMDLKLYDIVVYETDGMLVVHRIVEIEEPNAAHPDCRHFRLQGDAVSSPDRFPVLYEQMRAIYKGDRIPFIGSFILFMQSPAGWLCVLFALFTFIAMPLIDSKVKKAKEKRILLYISKDNEEVTEIKEEKSETTCEIAASRTTVYASTLKIDSVNVGELNNHYNENETVDIISLKEKKLILKKSQRIKILARGKIDKPLTVKADIFTAQATEKIEAAGGKCIKVAGGKDCD